MRTGRSEYHCTFHTSLNRVERLQAPDVLIKRICLPEFLAEGADASIVGISGNRAENFHEVGFAARIIYYLIFGVAHFGCQIGDGVVERAEFVDKADTEG